MEDNERNRYAEDVHKKVNASEANLILKQSKEMQALKKKLEAKMNERLKIRENEHNKILQRY
jgi:spore maturation protein CgeB